MYIQRKDIMSVESKKETSLKEAMKKMSPAEQERIKRAEALLKQAGQKDPRN
jgi:hypothetical protein